MKNRKDIIKHPTKPGMLYIEAYTIARSAIFVVQLSRDYSLFSNSCSETDTDAVLKFPSRLHLLSYCKSKTREIAFAYTYCLAWEP